MLIGVHIDSLDPWLPLMDGANLFANALSRNIHALQQSVIDLKALAIVQSSERLLQRELTSVHGGGPITDRLQFFGKRDFDPYFISRKLTTLTHKRATQGQTLIGPKEEAKVIGTFNDLAVPGALAPGSTGSTASNGFSPHIVC